MTFSKICWMLCTPGHTQFLGRHKSLIKLFKAPGGLDRYIAWERNSKAQKILDFCIWSTSISLYLQFANWFEICKLNLNKLDICKRSATATLMMVRIELGTKRISPHEITLPWSFLVCPPAPLLADMDFGAPWPTPDPFLSDCEVIHMSLSIGNLSQSSIEGHGKPWFSMVDRHPDFTFWHSDLGHRRKQVWPQAHVLV